LLALAEASAAEFLVTGDRGLQSLKHYKSTRIVSPAAMIELLKEGEKSRHE
jgi:predicted nucleic acid-binding protein